ncbi:MAG: LysR family transcriptional regulator, partial [Deltaproteobacteria bacterium]
DLNLMLMLHVVLLEQNVARAAGRLHVTPSAVSNALARLRDALGDPLVTRKGRGIVPTPRAIELAPILARTLHDLEAALVTAPFDAARCTRTFTVAVADVGQVAWIPRLAVSMRRELPLAHLRVVGIDSLVSLGDLGSSDIDLHLGIRSKGPGLHVEPLLEDRSLLVARRDHPAAAAGKLSRRALADLRHVRVDMVPGKRFGDPFAATFAQANIPREIVMTMPSFSTAAEVVAVSDLVTMLPSSLFAAKAASLGLRALATPLPAHTTKFAMSWHERTHADTAARAFRALVRRVVVE